MKYYIVVEGESDELFIVSYIAYLQSMNTLPESIDFEIELLRNVKVLKNKIKVIHDRANRDSSFDAHKIMAIIDADDKEDGEKTNGYENKKRFVEESRNDSKVDFACFLLPNNSSDGMLEDLLVDCVAKSPAAFKRCFDNYLACLKENELLAPNPKAKLYALGYSLFDKNKTIRISEPLTKKDKGKPKEEKYTIAKNFYHNKEVWNLNAPALEPLKTFLTANLT